MYHFANFKPGQPEHNRKNYVWAPIYSVLVEHQDGIVLYDAGVNTADYIVHPEIRGTGLYDIKPEEHLIARIMQIGIAPSEITHVVISHLHHDHDGWIHAFPNAKVYVPRTEFEHRAGRYLLGKGANPREICEWARAQINWELVDSYETKLLDGITIYNYGPGHSGGMLTMLVELDKDGNKLVISDVAHDMADLHSGPEHISECNIDHKGEYDTRQDTIRLAEKFHAEIWFGHDREQYLQMKKSPDEYYE
jgi:glyoxylase-like metal-dependent hydrolase (beta-lactamase superfamily II)